jgi:uncharacterized membrane protein
MGQPDTKRSSAGISPALLAVAVLAAGLVVFGIAAPGAYNVYKMLHVVAAVVWVGGGVMIAILSFLMEREHDALGLATLGRQAEYLSTRLFIPSSLAVLVFGIAMMIKGDLDWGQFWVIVGLVGFAATFLTGVAFLTPQTKKLAALAESNGPDHAMTQDALARLLVIVRFDVAMLLVVVADMAAKPFS